MAFELTMAAKRAPQEAPDARFDATAPSASYVVSLSGTFDGEASQAVLSTVSQLAANASESILIRMETVHASGSACLESFADGLMTLRAAGTNVQVAALNEHLHEKLAGAPNARDWLVDASVEGPRRALHVDGTMRGGSASSAHDARSLGVDAHRSGIAEQ